MKRLQSSTDIGSTSSFAARELAAMSAVSVVKTANRSIVGTMNEFAFLAEAYRVHMDTGDLPALSMRLAETPCSAIKHNSPSELIEEFLGPQQAEASALLQRQPWAPGRPARPSGLIF